MLRKILIALGIFLLLFIVAAVSIPYFFKDKIMAEVKSAANENLNATLDFKDVDISLFRHFPKLTVGLQGLEIIGKEKFEGIRLLRCENLDVAVDFWSAIGGGDLTINSVFLDRPDIRVFVLKDGSANYDITKPTTQTTTTKPSSVKTRLERYEIKDGKIHYEDRTMPLVLDLEHLNHSGKGEFSSDLYDLVMTTEANSMTVDYDGTRYLLHAQTDWKATLSMDMSKMKFTFKENALKINDLDVNLDGFVALPNDKDIEMDLRWSAPTNDFKNFLSIIPGAYTKDFAGVQASGKVRFAGFAKGIYNEKTYPAFALDMGIEGGNVKYPSLPLGISNINLDAKIKSPSSNLNQMTVDLPDFSLKIGQNPIAGHFFLKTPLTDPDVDLKLNGVLNLADFSKAYPLDGVQTLVGLVKADVFMKARQSQLDAQDFANVNMGGSFNLTDLKYDAAGSPSIEIKSAAATIAPGRVDLPDFDAKLGKSDLKMSGFVDAPLAYFSPKKTMTGSLKFNSFYFDANEWMTPTTTQPAGNQAVSSEKKPTDNPTAASEKPFDRWNFTLDGDFKKLVYETYSIENIVAKGNFTPNKMDIADFGLKIGNSDLRGSGQINNAFAYLFDNQTVSGAVNLSSGFFDLNQFMTEDSKTASKTTTTTTSTAALDPIVVPQSIDFLIDANFAKLLYDNLSLENLTGKIVVKNGVASLENCVAQTLGGGIALTGKYDSRDASKPAFDMNFALQNMGFRAAYDNFISIKKLAPIAQLIDGKFNTSLSMSGNLGKDMMPDFNTLTAAGFLETIAAAIKNWKPLNEIGDKLNVSYLKSLDLKNTRNFFEIKDGKVLLKPFDMKMNDVALNIGGSHSLTQDMDYKILAKVPRKLLEKNQVGAAANSGLNWVSGEANKIGLNVKNGEFVNVLFGLGGSLFSPKLTAKVVGSDGESAKDVASEAAAAAVEKAKDSLKTVAQKEFEKGKKAASDAAQKAIDSLNNVAKRKADEAAAKLKEEAKTQAGKVLDKELGDKVGEKVGEKAGQAADKVLGGDGKKKVDEAKEKLEKWDPFKKKKN